MKRAVWTDKDLHKSGYKKPMSKNDPYIAPGRKEKLSANNVITGSEALLRELCRRHKAIMAVHEQAGRQVRWLL